MGLIKGRKIQSLFCIHLLLQQIISIIGSKFLQIMIQDYISCELQSSHYICTELSEMEGIFCPPPLALGTRFVLGTGTMYPHFSPFLPPSFPGDAQLIELQPNATPLQLQANYTDKLPLNSDATNKRLLSLRKRNMALSSLSFPACLKRHSVFLGLYLTGNPRVVMGRC